MLERYIEDILYNSPWLIDQRYDVPCIKGSGGYDIGRQINVGKNGVNRYIDLLLRDTRDNRPVIIEIKNCELYRENIAQILEYKALIISLEAEKQKNWEDEFGKNYYCPKLMLIGTKASDEIKMSANMAGVEIRLLENPETNVLDLSKVFKISEELNNWQKIIKTGNVLIGNRDEWVMKVYKWFRDLCNEFDGVEICKPPQTKEEDAWILSEYPFLNFTMKYKSIPICGVFEFFGSDSGLNYSEEHFYFEYNMKKGLERGVERTEKSFAEMKLDLDKAGYMILDDKNGLATMKISRGIFKDYKTFEEKMTAIVANTLRIYNQFTPENWK